MGILSDFFLAQNTSIPNYAGGEEIDTADKCQFKGLSPLQGGQFLAVLRGQKYVVDMIGEFQLVTPEDADEWTMRVPDDMVQKLAEIQSDQIGRIAEEFAGVTSEELGWSRDDFIPIVTALSALARRAIQTNKSMYLWNSL